jgi:putative SOS response-associated peptidase YedK
MCGRFFRKSPREELAAAFQAELGFSSAEPGYNIAPGTPIVTVRFNPKTHARTLDDLHWGLIPFFAKDRKIGWKTINARAETIDTAPLYRKAFERRRCLIVADGFFEWKALGKRRYPYAIALENGAPFALAGVWENWQDPETGEWVRSCSIVTTEANSLVGRIHDRMPVILDPADYPRWLGEESAAPAELKELLQPFGGELVMWPVSPRMNRQEASTGPEVIEPVEEPSEAATQKRKRGRAPSD